MHLRDRCKAEKGKTLTKLLDPMIFPLALILCFIVSCQHKEAMAVLVTFKAQAAVEEQNKGLAERYFDALSNADVEALKEILSPDYVHHSDFGLNESLEEALEGLKLRVTMFPDQNFTVEDMFVKGGKLVWRRIFSGTHKGDIEGFPAAGKKVEMRGFAIIRIENGKIVENWGSKDTLCLYQQLGFELKS